MIRLKIVLESCVSVLNMNGIVRIRILKIVMILGMKVSVIFWICVSV